MVNMSSRKRSRELAEDCTARHMRRKLPPPSTSSTASDPSVSDDSALIPTSVPEDTTDASEPNTDSESEVSESSEEPSSESSSEEDSDESDLDSNIEESADDETVNLRANRGRKPRMKLRKDELGPDIRDFLKDFMPQLKAANEKLEADKKAGRLKAKEIDAGGEEGQYIEMDLGLGVFEEQKPDAEFGDSGGDSDGSSDSEVEGQQKEKDILGKLMGRERKSEGFSIQEVSEKQTT